MQFILSLFALIFTVSVAVEALPKLSEENLKNWADFKKSFGKNYETKVEENDHMMAFLKTQKLVEEHNLRYKSGVESYQMGINKFSDMTPLERQNYNGYRGGKRKTLPIKRFDSSNATDDLPDGVDWRNEGLVTNVKDQGACGSCWSFSAIGSLEGQWRRAGQNLTSLSEQNLVDCVKTRNTKGCNGGLEEDAYDYIQKKKGVHTDVEYPYIGRENKKFNKKCIYNKTTIIAPISGFIAIEKYDEGALKAAVATQGPISVAIDVEDSFLNYDGGVYYEKHCQTSDESLNHAVLLVGYGTTTPEDDTKKGQDYWIVKNSWGTDWGEDGYIRMARNRKNNCGIATDAIYPVIHTQ